LQRSMHNLLFLYKTNWQLSAQPSDRSARNQVIDPSTANHDSRRGVFPNVCCSAGPATTPLIITCIGVSAPSGCRSRAPASASPGRGTGRPCNTS
jgi:hypothetical protein